MSTPLRVLVVEDSSFHAKFLVDELRRGGYEPVARRVDTREDMQAALSDQDWDLVLCDYVMPCFSAPKALDVLHETGLDIPCIVVSGSIGEDEAVATMRAGAHDYLLKSNLARLVPAVERELREATARKAQRAAQEALRASETLLRAIMDHVPDAVVTTDLAGVIRTANPAAERLFGYPSHEVAGRHVELLTPEPEWLGLGSHLASYGDNGNGRAPVPVVREVVGQRRNGDPFPIELTLGAMAGGSQQLLVLSLRDITERKRSEELLEHQALHDALTGLPNRTLLHDRLHQAILAAHRDRKPVALLVMDLDRFKDVNDTFGHPAGDLVLLEVGHRLRAALREPDTIARLGGDEFAIVLPGTDAQGSILAAQRLLSALEEPFEMDARPLMVGGSIGIALCPEHGDEPETLFRRADVAMYVAKRARSGYALYTLDQDTHTPGRLALVGELRQAIEHDQLMLHYQPKISLPIGRIVGVEALVRWPHPQHGMLPPDQFIPLAEQTGLIEPLSRWVLSAALRQCHTWRHAGLDLPVAVNLSTHNLLDPELPQTVAALLDQWDVPTSGLRLEITESAVMADPVQAMQVLTRLRAMGVRVDVDDFGTGYSSLAYLKRLPLDELKIDKSFVQHMAVDEGDAAIVRSTIGLAHDLGLCIVAEGVEDEATWDLLGTLGCDTAQGYYLCRPLPADDLAEWIRQSPWSVDGGASVEQGIGGQVAGVGF